MKRSVLKPAAAIVILVASITAFIYYFATHESVRHQLAQVSIPTLALLLVLYIGSIIALAMIFVATLRLCKLPLKAGESALLTAYSSVINFFGPLQSGPAFRAVYLKKKYKLDLKSYGLATLVYYLFFGAFSCLFLLSGVFGWWIIPLVAAGLLAVYALSRTRRIAPRLVSLDLRGWYYLAVATFVQVSLLAVIYFIELRSVSPGIDVSQAIIYTGAANLALFVSLTPGAIGFRESFLVFSQHLHHVNNATIVAANIIDRAMYIVLMLLLALFIFSTHAKRQLEASSSNKKAVN